MALSALKMRFKKTCRRRSGFPLMPGRRLCILVVISMRSLRPWRARSSASLMRPLMATRLLIPSLGGRAKRKRASIIRDALWIPELIRFRHSLRNFLSPGFSSSNWAALALMPRGLRISWAIPPAIAPSETIFSVWISWASSAFLSVRSRPTPTKPPTVPS